MLKFLESAWLCIAIFTFAIAGWQFFTEGFSESILMLIGTAIALGMFFVRRRQRMRLAKYMNDQKNVSQGSN